MAPHLAPQPTTRPRSGRSGTRCVVVADDDPLYRELLCQCVMASGIAAIPAADAMQAMMYTVKAAPDAVLLDINMPGGSGFTALDRLRKNARTAHVPVIVVSGTSEPAAEARSRELGARAFLHKPVDPDLLLATLRTALAQSDELH